MAYIRSLESSKNRYSRGVLTGNWVEDDHLNRLTETYEIPAGRDPKLRQRNGWGSLILLGHNLGHDRQENAPMITNYREFIAADHIKSLQKASTDQKVYSKPRIVENFGDTDVFGKQKLRPVSEPRKVISVTNTPLQSDNSLNDWGHSLRQHLPLKLTPLAKTKSATH